MAVPYSNTLHTLQPTLHGHTGLLCSGANSAKSGSSRPYALLSHHLLSTLCFLHVDKNTHIALKPSPSFPSLPQNICTRTQNVHFQYFQVSLQAGPSVSLSCLADPRLEGKTGKNCLFPTDPSPHHWCLGWYWSCDRQTLCPCWLQSHSHRPASRQACRGQGRSRISR